MLYLYLHNKQERGEQLIKALLNRPAGRRLHSWKTPPVMTKKKSENAYSVSCHFLIANFTVKTSTNPVLILLQLPHLLQGLLLTGIFKSCVNTVRDAQKTMLLLYIFTQCVLLLSCGNGGVTISWKSA